MLVVARANGPITAEEIIGAFGDEIARTNGAALHSDLIVIFHQDADFHPMDFDALMRVKSSFEQWGKSYPGRNVRSAFVVPDKDQLATVSLWQAIADVFPGVGAETRIFGMELDALAWLRPGNELRH